MNKVGFILNQMQNSPVISTLGKICSSIVSDNKIETVLVGGLIFIKAAAYLGGNCVKYLSGDRVQLSKIIPPNLQLYLHGFSWKVPLVTTGITSLIQDSFKIKNEEPIAKVIVSPVVEEIAYRLPLIVASRGSNLVSSLFANSSFQTGAIYSGNILMIALSALSSIAFTYMHKPDFKEGEAESFFVSGMGLSYLALKSRWGIEASILSHSIHNFTVQLIK